MFTVITARHYCRYQGTVITYTLKCKQKQRHLHKLNNKHGTTTSLVRDTQREWGFVLSCWVRCWKWAQIELNSSTWLSPDSASTSIPYMYSCTFCLSCHIYFNSLHHLPLFPGSWAVKFTDISLSWGVKNAEVLQYSLMAFSFFLNADQILMFFSPRTQNNDWETLKKYFSTLTMQWYEHLSSY